MSYHAKKSETAQLQPRRLPAQQRSVARRSQIFDTTAKLLERVGIDDLTTILIAKEMNISVGALYHYFPNKHAILHGLGAKWLDEMTTALSELKAHDVERMDIPEFVELAVDRLLAVYVNQRAILPLMQIIDSVPELHEMDRMHDDMLIGQFTELFRRAHLKGSKGQLRRLATIYLETTHALFLLVVEQPKREAQKTILDIKRMCVELLRAKSS